MDEEKFLEFFQKMTKEEKILRFIHKEGEVNLYPIIEFFSGEEVLQDLVAAGLVAELRQPDEWHLYRLTDQGNAYVAGLPPAPDFN